MTAAAPSSFAQPWHRIRRSAPVRIVLYLGALILVLAGFGLATQALVPPAPSTLHLVLLPAKNLVMAATLLGVYALLVRVIERRHAREIGFRRGAGPFVVGLTVGAGLIGSVYLVLWALGQARFEAGTGWSGIELGLISAFSNAVLKELLLRAVLFRVLEEIAGTTIAVVLSALVFGALHGTYPGATAFSMLTTAIETGTLLALAFALTRNLWLAIGIHAGWNFAEGSLFGAAVSGTKEAHSLFNAELAGPNLLTGGIFGPEASLVTLGFCLGLAGLFAVLIRRQGHWRPPRLRLRLH